MYIKIFNTTILALSVSFAFAMESDIHNIDLPTGATTSWVATDMNHNGHGIAIKTLYTDKPADEVINFYRTAWKSESNDQADVPGFVENQIGDWQVISRLSDTHNLVVQVRQSRDGSAEGFISSMALVPTPERQLSRIPIPPNASQVSHTQTGDTGKSGFTTILVTPSSIGASIGHYRDHLSRDGWALVSDNFVEDSHVLKFNKRTSSFEIVVRAADDGTTVILLHRTLTNG